MSDLDSVTLATNFTKNRDEILKKISDSVEKLHSGLLSAIKLQAYLRVDPDQLGTEKTLEKLNERVDKIALNLNNANLIAADLLAVKSGEMTTEQLLVRYPAINLQEYSKELS